ncbi:protein kinase [Anatilimnocola sp. NA78]|uniref:WD40 repeat domain-containing serine/threonine protein kinase n=1 Tax=Anatilimnocola sp. NA78 TaxID=3415683 RepID=UPI003CE50207
MTDCCSTELLTSALAGSLPSEQETLLHRHLEECATCSMAMEQLAGGETWCQEAAALLSQIQHQAPLPARDEWSEIDFTVEHLEPADDPNLLGRLGGYDVLEIIGRGGMGVVLKAYDRELKRCVAIKVLAPHLANSPLAKKRFAREAQAAAAVVHPHVLAIHQVQASGRLPYLVMPLVAGESLAQRLAAQGTLELKEILRIGMQAAAGLSAAHEQGLVHRDVKPANILLEKGIERAVLTDFGLARAADDVTLTRVGIIAGTPQYMSPEQARGEPLDGRSDLFSLGCVLYEMATGVSPFRADSLMATIRRLVDDPPPAMASLNPELPRWFTLIVERLLAKDPARRYKSAEEVRALLEGCLAHLQQPTSVPLPAELVSAEPKPKQSPTARRENRLIWLALLLVPLIGLSSFFVLATQAPDIAGPWSGEDWGQITITQRDSGAYSGTYTETVAQDRGQFEVKWSRIERRFNGTWHEGTNRFGELSLRLVDQEIRGAITTDAKSTINPATPKLADLTWVRATPNAKPEIDQKPEINQKPKPQNDTFFTPRPQTWLELQTGQIRATKEQAALVETLIKTTSVTTDPLLDLFEYTTNSTNEYRLRRGIVSLPILPAEKSNRDHIPLGILHYQPGNTSFYLQWDAPGASKLHYYGPISFASSQARQLGLSQLTQRKLGSYETKNPLPPLRTFDVGERVGKVAITADGRLIAVSNARPQADVYQHSERWQAATMIVDAVAAKPLAKLTLISPEENELLKKLKQPLVCEVAALAFSPNGKVLAVGTTQGQVKLFDAVTGELIRSFDDVDGKGDATDTPELLRPFARALGSVKSLAFSPDGEQLVVAGAAVEETPLEKGRGEIGWKNSRLTRFENLPGRLKLWSVKSGKLLHHLAGHAGPPKATAFSPDGKLVASAGVWKDPDSLYGVKIWDAASGEMLRKINTNHNAQLRSLAFSSDSKRVIFAGDGPLQMVSKERPYTGSVGIGDVASGTIIWAQSLRDTAGPLAYLGDSEWIAVQLIAVLSVPRKLQLFDARTGTVWSEFRSQSVINAGAAEWSDLAIAPQAKLLALGGMDAYQRGTVELWLWEDVPAGLTPPKPAATSPLQRQVLEAELRQAQALLKRTEAAYEAGIASRAEQQAARSKVEILEAELTGNVVDVAKVKLKAAQDRFKIVSALHEAARISSSEYEQAKGDVEIAEVKLRAAQTAAKEKEATTSPDSK